jgi:hypothetical protein
MCKEIRSSTSLRLTFCIVMIAVAACTPTSNPSTDVPVATATEVKSIENHPPVAYTPGSGITWPVYTLETELPNSPSQLRLYSQVVPAELPDEQRLTALMEQLKITGTVSTQTTEAGDSELSVVSEMGSFRLVSDDPFLLIIENSSQMQTSNTPVVDLSPELRIQSAEAFLSERGLLDFPYVMEIPRLSRERDQVVRVVPLIDGVPLYDYDPLNGRLLVWFNSTGEISMVFWRPLKLVAKDMVDIVPADVAWDQLVTGDTPKSDAIGQCWQATVFDPNEPYGMASAITPSCVNWSSGPPAPFSAASINEISLVYFAHDLSLGMSPFAFAADSLVHVVFPMWQFSGTTNDERDLVVLWPAIKAP